MTIVPLVLLLTIDVLLIASTLFLKLNGRVRNSVHNLYAQKQKRSNRKTFTKLGAFRNDGEYRKIIEAPSIMTQESDIHMESHITNLNRRPTRFGDLGFMEAEYMYDEDDDAPNTDLKDFVNSLSKCLGSGQFGLSFEFEDLMFQPDKNRKPILEKVSGMIDAGSLWGVMGASGAGKCEFSSFSFVGESIWSNRPRD